MFPQDQIKADQIKLLALSFIFTLLFYLTTYVETGGDAMAYYGFAELIAGGKVSSFDAATYYQTRGIGYPALLWILGAVKFHTFIPVLILQSLMAFLIPWLVYRTVAEFNRESAFFSGLIAIFSCLPYIFMKSILAKQGYLFFQFAAIYFCARYLKNGSPRLIYPAAIFLFLMILFSPQALLFSLSLLTVLFFLNPRRYVHYIGAGLLLTAFYLGSNEVKRQVMARADVPESGQNISGIYLFHNVYNYSVYGPRFLGEGKHVITSDVGPYTREMIEIIGNYLHAERDDLPGLVDHFRLKQSDREFWVDRFAGRPEELTREVFESPSLYYYYLVVRILNETQGPVSTNKILLRSTLEILQRYPQLGIRLYLGHLKAFTLGPYRYFGYNKLPSHRLKTHDNMLYTLSSADDVEMNIRLAPDFKKEVTGLPIEYFGWTGLTNWCKYANKIFIEVWNTAYGYLQPLIFLSMLIGTLVLIAVKSPGWQLALLISAVYAYNAIVVCIFAHPSFNHHYMVDILELVVAVMFAGYLIRYFRGKIQTSRDREG